MRRLTINRIGDVWEVRDSEMWVAEFDNQADAVLFTAAHQMLVELETIRDALQRHGRGHAVFLEDYLNGIHEAIARARGFLNDD